MTHSLTHDALIRLSTTRRLSPFASVVVRFAALVVTWEMRRRTRRHLVHLDDHLLQDVGLTRNAARTEARRLFWQI